MTQLISKYNYPEIDKNSVINYRYFEFSYQEPSVVIGIIPKNHMISNVTIAVIQAFLPAGSNINTTFSLHLKGSSIGSVANDSLATSRTFHPFIGDNTSNQDMLRILKEDTLLMFSIINGENNSRGSGWGLIEYINMATIPGYRRL